MPFIELQTTDSTNNYALSQIHAGMAQHGMTIFAHEQTMGRGQRGKKWVSNAGDNIALSMIINPASLLIAEQFQFSACTAVAVHNFFEKYAGSDTKIKWPNDLYWKDRKAGGILIESVVGRKKPGLADDDRAIRDEQSGARWQWAVVGVGINVNQASFPSDLVNPVSLKQITGKQFDAMALAKELCSEFDACFRQLINGGFDDILSQYNTYLFRKNEAVKLKKDNRVFTAVIKKVSRQGKLVVEHGIEEELDFGSVEWVLER